MSQPRIAIAGFQHETNTFAPMPTKIEDFQLAGAWPGLMRGPQVLETFTGLNIPLSGFIDAGDDMDLVPLFWGAAEPGGYVDQGGFDRMVGMICEDLAAAKDLDGVFLDLHGAMVTDDYEDGEGEVLRRVRAVVGDDLPIAVSLDLHGNQTQAFVDLATVVTIYRTYPHIDMADTGARARALLAQVLKRGAPFAKAFRQVDYMVPIQAQSTMHQPCKRIYEEIVGFEGGEIVSTDLAMGFPPADIHHCGASLVAYGESQEATDRAADGMLAVLHDAEKDFHDPLIPAEEAVRQAMELARTASKPVSIADPQDNPGAGATGDTTGILEALIKLGARKACLAMLWDPDAAAKAHEVGVGGTFQASLGGKYPEVGCQPVNVAVTVEALSDGSFMCTGPMYGGSQAELGPMATLLIEENGCEVRVVVGSVRTQNADQAMFRHIGIDPTAQDIAVIKSAVHFLADYQPISETVLFADAPGANPCKLDQIAYRRLRKGLRLGANGPAFGGPKS